MLSFVSELNIQVKKTIILFFFVWFAKSLAAQAYKTSNPDSIKIITTYVDNFWNTYDKLSQGQTLTDSIQIIQKYYLDKTSYGLKEYIGASNSTAADFSNAIKNHKNYLSSNRPTTTSIQNYESKIRDAALIFIPSPLFHNNNISPFIPSYGNDTSFQKWLPCIAF